jgi:hypothetical protein
MRRIRRLPGRTDLLTVRGGRGAPITIPEQGEHLPVHDSIVAATQSV